MTADTEQVIKPQVERREIKEPRIDTEDFEIGVFGGLLSVEDFGVNPVLGARAAYHISEDFFVEAAVGQSTTTKTSYERLSGAAELLTADERKLSYYNLSLGYNVLPGEAFVTAHHAFNTALYVIAGVGSTHFAGDDRFTVNLGAGYRFLATDWLAIHGDVRDHLFDMDLLGSKQKTNNIEITLGATAFF
jgi:outer membrane beta-barrel protein